MAAYPCKKHGEVGCAWCTPGPFMECEDCRGPLAKPHRTRHRQVLEHLELEADDLFLVARIVYPHVLLEVSVNGVNVVEATCDQLMWIARYGGGEPLFTLRDVPGGFRATVAGDALMNGPEPWNLKITATPIGETRALGEGPQSVAGARARWRRWVRLVRLPRRNRQAGVPAAGY